MAKVYVFEQGKVNGRNGFDLFCKAAPLIVKQYGGRILAKSPNPDLCLSNLQNMLLLIEFDSTHAAQRFYNSPEYQECIKLRSENSDFELQIIEGLN